MFASSRAGDAGLAEREVFEPSIVVLTLYSLSRGAPSDSRASLRGNRLRVWRDGAGAGRARAVCS